MFKVRTNFRVCLQITEFHWTLFDPVHQDRVKKALLELFEQVEEKVPEKAEFKRHLNEFLKGRFPSGSLTCCVPWERSTQRYDDGKELPYYQSGKPDGLKVPKPARDRPRRTRFPPRRMRPTTRMTRKRTRTRDTPRRKKRRKSLIPQKKQDNL